MKLAVRVVGEAEGGWLTVGDLRGWLALWDDLSGSWGHAHDSAEPVFMTEGQGGRVSRITAEMPVPSP